MPRETTWQQWLPRLYNLRRDKRGSHKRPHKPSYDLAEDSQPPLPMQGL